MLPEKRRAGRAIRKEQRQARESAQKWADFVAAARVAIVALTEFQLAVVAAAGEFVERFSRATGPYWVIQELDASPLPLGPPAVATAEPGAGTPSQTGGEALRSAPGAIEGMEPHLTIYDEPWGFGEEYDDEGQ